jgi:hypothetical protein
VGALDLPGARGFHRQHPHAPLSEVKSHKATRHQQCHGRERPRPRPGSLTTAHGQQNLRRTLACQEPDDGTLGRTCLALHL